MLTAEEIRKQFPNPTVGTTSRTDVYCVGGALCMANHGTRDIRGNTDTTIRFPSHIFLAKHLRIANPMLDRARAIYFANYIIDFNDELLFKAAWNMLEKALTYEGSDHE